MISSFETLYSEWSSSEEIALITEGEQLTYGNLSELMDQLFPSLSRGDLVLLVTSNTLGAVVGYLGFLSRGVVPLMVDQKIDCEKLRTLIEHYQPNYLWAPQEFLSKIDREVAPLATTATAGNFKSDPLMVYGTYRLLKRSDDRPIQLHPDLALLLSTSGSTGSPKYVRLSHKNLMSNAQSIRECLAISMRDRAITTLPLSYSYGLSIINSHLLAGASIVLTERTLVDRGFWDLLRTSEATTFGGVPYTYSMLRRLHFESMSLPSIRSITQAGGGLGDELHEWFAKTCSDKGIDFVVMYGQTEATARIAYLPPQFARDKIGSVGIPILGGNIDLIDKEGCSIKAPSVDGTLVYRGNNVALGYATSCIDLSKGDENNGLLVTGDIARSDEDGFFYITGREKRFLKLYGNRVNLDEIEAILSKEGLSVACAGDDDTMRIYIEAAGGESGNADVADKEDCAVRVHEQIARTLGIHKGAFIVEMVESLPRNSSGKIQYTSLETAME